MNVTHNRQDDTTLVEMDAEAGAFSIEVIPCIVDEDKHYMKVRLHHTPAQGGEAWAEYRTLTMSYNPDLLGMDTFKLECALKAVRVARLWTAKRIEAYNDGDELSELLLSSSGSEWVPSSEIAFSVEEPTVLRRQAW